MAIFFDFSDMNAKAKLLINSPHCKWPALRLSFALGNIYELDLPTRYIVELRSQAAHYSSREKREASAGGPAALLGDVRTGPGGDEASAHSGDESDRQQRQRQAEDSCTVVSAHTKSRYLQKLANSISLGLRFRIEKLSNVNRLRRS